MKKWSQKIQIIVFVLFISAFGVISLVLPDKLSSEMENRGLAQLPDFSADKLISGDLMAEYESYLTDQFAGRDSWITLKSYLELLLLKKENNGVYLGSENTLLSRFDEPEEKRLQANLNALNRLTETAGVPVIFSLIPSSTSVWKDRLPTGAPTADEKALIDRLYADCVAQTVDVYGALAAHVSEDLYYRTDHHWTTLGAYYGYAALMQTLGNTPAPLSSFAPTTVNKEFCGTAYSSSGMRWIPPDTIQRFVPSGSETVKLITASGEKEWTLYHEEFLDVKDKYAYFLGGNHPEVVIETGNDNLPAVLIIRDSYTDCEAPFLLSHFSRIHLIDLRHYKQSVGDYIRENAIDTVFVQYGLSNFCTDPNVYMLQS